MIVHVFFNTKNEKPQTGQSAPTSAQPARSFLQSDIVRCIINTRRRKAADEGKLRLRLRYRLGLDRFLDAGQLEQDVFWPRPL